MSKLIEHASREIAIMREQSRKALMAQETPTESALQFQLLYEAMHNNLLAMVAVFSTGRYSGSIAPIAISQLNQLLNFKPLSPLTGEDDEWTDKNQLQPGLLQNIRCSSVFKDTVKNECFQIDVFVWFNAEYPNGYTNKHSNAIIKEFPYFPRDKEYIDTTEMQQQMESKIAAEVERTR